ncbi:MAG TPA: M28 family peptidase [Terriglobales bacterium]|nr:M28 family peptidase [Terriglobales bacterium]
MRKLIAVLILVTTVTAAFAQEAAKPAKPAKAKTSPKQSTRVYVAGMPAGVTAAMNAIDAEKIRAHDRFLSDDLLEGRGTGQRGGDIAARYMAEEFEQYGLKPAGDNGTYFQKVPMVGMTVDPKQTTFALVPHSGAAMDLKFADDYITSNQSQTPVADVNSDIVFVGYGIDAPEFDWNDYKDVDLHGKVLLMLVSEPPSDDVKFFNGKALTYYGRWVYKYEEAARRGAVGVLIIHKTDMASYGWEVVRNSWSGESSYLAAGNQPKLKAASWIQLEVARKLFAAAGKDLDQEMEAAKSRDFHPVELSVRLKAHIVSKVRQIDSSNVVAVLPGADPKLKHEAILYTAHYDHFGIRPGESGDNIYNGALDNGTGCAMLLELARAWTLAVPKPRRSIYFAAVTAEEQGLLGSKYLGEHPPVPAKDIQLDLNYDDVKPYGYPEQLEVVGYDRTTFAPVVEQTAKEFRLTIMPDAAPEAGHYYRSDHFSMARVGVPAFSVNTGRKYRDKTLEWGDQMYNEYTAKDYHHPSDEYRPEFDFTANAVMSKFGFALGWRAVESPKTIEWKKDDEFEHARVQSKQGGAE